MKPKKIDAFLGIQVSINLHAKRMKKLLFSEN
ncbi:hypothetical protein MGAS9429_Spy1158 [Streptococcus pyogenes MGAS9429]|uniref:Uncharacterized protein n=1 Tax=Streptococcus pyogenes serotype M12 (strain MGAS9429) TaxID=370551 RepID=Q1JL74_STRPC|nr:hypothetical protein MGAS9429_Spy1158 [Streptococcus pyogenes MGAS9429]